MSDEQNPMTETKPSLTEKAPTVLEPWVLEARNKALASQRHPVKIAVLRDETGKDTFKAVGDTPGETIARRYETTGYLDADASLRLMDQIVNAQPRPDMVDIERMNSAAAIMNGIAPETPLEGLLAAQMTAAHNMAMEFSRRAMKEGQTEEGIERNVNRAAKLMKAFTAQVDALHKLRNKGQQKITVQHVQVNQGGQAVIGDIKQGGG